MSLLSAIVLTQDYLEEKKTGQEGDLVFLVASGPGSYIARALTEVCGSGAAASFLTSHSTRKPRSVTVKGGASALRSHHSHVPRTLVPRFRIGDPNRCARASFAIFVSYPTPPPE